MRLADSPSSLNQPEDWAEELLISYADKNVAEGREQHAIQRLSAEGGWHFEFPASRESDAERFYRLASQWKRDTMFLSSVHDMAMHSAYQEIIGMGRAALRLILKELRRKPDHWFWALRAITGVNPVPREHRGNVTEMANDWIQWADAGKHAR